MNDARNLPARVLAVLSLVVGAAIAAPPAAQAAGTVLGVTPGKQVNSTWGASICRIVTETNAAVSTALDDNAGNGETVDAEKGLDNPEGTRGDWRDGGGNANSIRATVRAGHAGAVRQ